VLNGILKTFKVNSFRDSPSRVTIKKLQKAKLLFGLLAVTLKGTSKNTLSDVEGVGAAKTNY
jgi:hypothetical protein